MRVFSSYDTALTMEYGIEIGRWCQYDGVEGFPFKAMWCVVPAGSHSALDQHAEAELAIVVGGHARMQVEDRAVDAPAGTAVLLEPHERHVIHNLDDEAPLRILSVYWLPDEALDPVRKPAPPARRPVESAAPATTIVLVPPPTPNGMLHVGHLAGPYVAADVAVRAARLRGEPTIAVCGLDDHQNYVLTAARAEGGDPEALRSRYAQSIRQVFDRLNIHYDIFTEPATDLAYRAAAVRLMEELIADGVLADEEWTAPVCQPCGGTLHHAYVGGRCRHCAGPAHGGTCEACGGFCTAKDLRGARCMRCGVAPSTITTVQGPVLRLADHREFLLEVWSQATLPRRVRQLIERLLKDGLPTIPVTYPTDWGIAFPGRDGHRIDVWAEMWLGYLYAVGRHFDPRAQSVAELVAAWRGVGKVWAFLGMDNAFYYAVMFPAMFGALGLPADLLSGLIVNEFYTLDGEKFSTSRRHAVWAHELLERHAPAVVRAFLCWDRPQGYESDFTLAHFHRVTGDWPDMTRPRPVSAAELIRAEHALTYQDFAPALAARCLMGGSGTANREATSDAEAARRLVAALIGMP